MHDSAQANGLRNDCLNEREYPIRFLGKCRLDQPTNLTANYRGSASIQHHTFSLSVIKLTG
jgi:hypothetical protein